ncbi:hypothetical protein GCM10009682_53820 [Luedemannella flava]|uniref:Secreted protein n=1 Tax=Luedemannella flava TaxID=349316 RepID=A0ABP4YWJ3_9ACTN
MSQPTTPPARRGLPLARIALICGIIVPVLGLLIQAGKWLFPDGLGGRPDPEPTKEAVIGGTPAAPQSNAVVATGAAATTSAAPAVTAAADGRARLDSLTRDAGQVAKLPRAFAGKAGFDGAVTVACPSNESDQPVREVTYLLHGRYLDLSATIQPSFADPDFRGQVTVDGVWRNPDGTVTRRTVGGATTDGRATAALAGALDVEGAEKLVLVVDCDVPTGVVIIKDGRLTRVS